MRLVHVLLPLQVVLVSLVATGTLTANGEQPSTLFVLDTSDSDSAPVSGGGNNQHNSAAEPAADASTRIVSDEQASGHNQRKQSNQTNHQRAATAAPASSAHSQHEKHGPGSSTQSSHEHGQAPVTSRRLDEPAYLAPAHAASSHQQQQHASGQQGASQAQRKQTTTASPYESEQNSSVPKSEERLLISITSEDLDEPYKKVVSASSNQGYEETHTPSGPAGQQVHHHQKRKPAITISIQDANLNKQTGGAGTQAVIVRPGEDGQSIVIATVGAASVSNTNGNNKYKPAQAGAGDSIPSQQQQRPYQEPANNPIQAIVAQHLVTSTTRRPPAGDYNSQPPANQNRPVASTLTDERPQRPVLGGLDERPNQAHVRPTQEPYSPNGGGGHSGNQDAANEPPSSYDHSQGAATGEDQRKYPLSEKNCGIMHETRIVGGDVADPDDFMWMAAIIKSKPNNGEPRPFCGGSLITRRHILTAAHCLEGLAPRDVLVRLGSYDFEDSASSSSADYAIDQFRVPAQYSRKTHVADLAIMRLKTPLSPNDQYKTVCMPQPRRSYVGAYGLVTGYGSQSQTFRKAAPKLRQVTVPIWENRECSKVYNKTMGDSFLCAGYEAGGKDACQGDSGGPIMTEGPGQKMMIVGVVSHGIGCGSPGYPGVYTRTTTFADWIEKNTKE